MTPINSKRKILIVDDMPANIQVLAGALKSDYQIKIATSGAAALNVAFSDDPPDLVLLDIMMPEMDGYEVLKQLKENENTQKIPVIFVTAKGEVEDEARGLGMGAVDYISKPFHLPIVAARVKTQIDLKHKTEMLENLVALDGLTGIANRRKFNEHIDSEWQRAGRNGHQLSLIMMDIDHFKNYNDNYGHAVGDDCLRRVASTLNALVHRSGDLVARYGGEEFAVILPDVNTAGASSVAERMREAVLAQNIPHLYSPVADQVTLSMGAATIRPHGDGNPVTLIKAADKALYEAKRAGRNRLKAIDLN